MVVKAFGDLLLREARTQNNPYLALHATVYYVVAGEHAKAVEAEQFCREGILDDKGKRQAAIMQACFQAWAKAIQGFARQKIGSQSLDELAKQSAAIAQSGGKAQVLRPRPRSFQETVEHQLDTSISPPHQQALVFIKRQAPGWGQLIPDNQLLRTAMGSWVTYHHPFLLRNRRGAHPPFSFTVLRIPPCGEKARGFSHGMNRGVV